MKSLHPIFSCIWYGAAIAALVACSPMPHRQVVGPDWQGFTVTRHEGSVGAVVARCYRHVPAVDRMLGGVALGCAEVDYAKSTCDYYCVNGLTCTHEALHCAGQDHGDMLQKAWSRYVDSQLARAK